MDLLILQKKILHNLYSPSCREGLIFSWSQMQEGV